MRYPAGDPAGASIFQDTIRAMNDMNVHANAQLALSRLWPRIRKRYARHAQRSRLDDFRAALDQDFPRLFMRLSGLYDQHWDFYYHLEQLLSIAAKHWLSAESPARPYSVADHSWILSENAVGATGYVDLFAGDLNGLSEKADYLQELGITYLHLMPFFDVPDGDSDGGYAIRDYGAVNPKVGTMEDLHRAAEALKQRDIRLVFDFVFNHTSDDHEWARKAKAGHPEYQQFYWLFRDEAERDQYAPFLRDIFPDKRAGCFTWNEDVAAWVWTTFNSFQWDLNYANPAVFNAMCEEMLKLVDAGADVIRLDALAFTWKQKGTTCENLPGAHQLIQAFNAFLRISAPSVVLKSEAIVAPDDVVQYIDEGECPLSYNPNLMALMWEALATRQTRLLITGSRHRSTLPANTAWVNYLRCHDDIGWAFADQDAWQSGINPHDHRAFLNRFYTGQFPGSFARGVPFQQNPANGDCRISGTLASLAGLEQAQDNRSGIEYEHAVKRILMLHGVMLAFRGIPLIYLGDEIAMLNDYQYLQHPAHFNDSRWVHRVTFTDSQNAKRQVSDSPEAIVFAQLQQMIQLRKQWSIFGDSELSIADQVDEHLFAFTRTQGADTILVLANFSEHERQLSASQLMSLGLNPGATDLLSNDILTTDSLNVAPYQLFWFLNSEIE